MRLWCVAHYLAHHLVSEPDIPCQDWRAYGNPGAGDFAQHGGNGGMGAGGMGGHLDDDDDDDDLDDDDEEGEEEEDGEEDDDF